MIKIIANNDSSMNGSVFTPNLKSAKPETDETPGTEPAQPDTVGELLLKIAQYSVLAIFGFIPLFFTPGLWASLGFDKVIFATVMCGLAVISMSLLALRRRQAKTVLPISLAIFWGVVGVAVLSALVSGDVQDALVGSVLGQQTAGFLLLMALVMTVTLVMQGSKIMTIKALAVFGCVSGVLLLYNILRIIFGAQLLSFGSFPGVTTSPIGGFNDLALFAGLIVLLGLITLLQLPLRGLTQWAVAVLIYMGLFVLAVVNFFSIWIIVGFFGLLLFVYLLSRDTLFIENQSEEKKQPISKVLLITTAIVCVMSALFIAGGEYAGNRVSALSNINYIEVRPSVEATINITKAVYNENIVFGIGPNRFSDAWRMHKDISINETFFWDTDFEAGFGYIPTLFATLGVTGVILLLAFHGYFLLLGYRMFLRNSIQDSYWYFFGIVSFAGAVFLWAMSYLYVPGVSILLLTAVFTGFTFVAYASTAPSAQKTVPLASSRQRGFFLMAAAIIIITTTVGTLSQVGEQYSAQAQFSESQAVATSAEEFEQVAFSSFQLFPDDRFVSTRAQIHLATLNSILAIAEPTEADQQRFINAAEQANSFAQQAVQADPTNPDNHAVLAAVYNALNAAGFEGADERANAALATAQALDPLNPAYKLLAAQIALRAGQVEQAKTEIAAALNLKRNYTQALYLSTQIDISEGNVESAIEKTRAIIALEPDNPTRYFQLGVLLLANENATAAINALQAAILRDAEYANARYFLGLAYIDAGQTDLALEQLERVQQTNQENQELTTLIEQVRSGEVENIPAASIEAPVNELGVNEGSNPTVPGGDNLDTDLITPVNTVPADEESAPASTSEPEPVAEPATSTPQTE